MKRILGGFPESPSSSSAIMLSIRTILIVLFICSSSLTSDDLHNDASDKLEGSHGKIIHASVIFRHGDRTPNNDSVLVPYSTESIWPEGLGQLNNKGKQRIYDLGKWFRLRYQNMPIVAEGYRYDMILVNSSDYDRTLMSAELFLAGFSPPRGNEIWADDGLRWQPIPVHSKPISIDEFIAGEPSCERLDLELYNANQLPEVLEYYYENRNLLEFVAENSGHKISSSNVLGAVRDLGKVANILDVEVEYNLSLPSWTNGIYPTPLASIFIRYMLSYTITTEMRRLKAGPILGRIISDMQSKRSGSFNQTMHLYSGHDMTIVNILHSLGLYDCYMVPDYGSSLMFELRQKNEEYLVTILYRNSTETAPRLLSLTECGDICTLDKFAEIIRPLVPDNWEDECKVGWAEKAFNYNKTLIIILICFLLLFASAVAAYYIIVMCVKKRTLAQEYTSI